MQELQRTLTELEREEREMAAQRLSGQTKGQQHMAGSSQHLQSDFQAGSTQPNQQVHRSYYTNTSVKPERVAMPPTYLLLLDAYNAGIIGM